MKRILHVVGARPNFPKIAPLIPAIWQADAGCEQILIHTGQHYDYNMSRVFFDELELPDPDEHLNIGTGTHAEQTARVMLAFEPVLKKYQPDWVVVVGDVNSTLGCALVCSKVRVGVAHVEAGLRSFDRSMPEEINRLLTDQVADLLLTPSSDADTNLLREGISPEKIAFVGNIMIDTLVKMLPKSGMRSIRKDLDLLPGEYILATLHRPFNVDNPLTLREIWDAIQIVSQRFPVVFPVHPRTRKNIDAIAGIHSNPRIRLLEPLGYLDFLALTRSAALVLTDSGGIQEETTYLGIPCLTVRPNTERPATITHGTNRLVPSTKAGILEAVDSVFSNFKPPDDKPELWDGKTANRIARLLLDRSPVVQNPSQGLS
jgi:UDP-N-acetylglucosamine 2-epimerase (non-hydrolysing)